MRARSVVGALEVRAQVDDHGQPEVPQQPDVRGRQLVQVVAAEQPTPHHVPALGLIPPDIPEVHTPRKTDLPLHVPTLR